MTDPAIEIRQTLQSFQDGYIARDITKLDEFMELFFPSDDTELIGIGASSRNENEWFQGIERIREIIESDWTYWGDVKLDVEGARITVQGDAAWLSTTGSILQTDHIHSEDVTGFTLKQMKEMLDDENMSQRDRIIETAHFGVRRWRERMKPSGHPWPFVLTAMLIKHEDIWRFHTIHWSMPVD